MGGKKTYIRKCCCKFFEGCLLWPKRAIQRPRLLLLLLGLFIQVFHFANTSYPAPHWTKVDEPVLCLNECLTGVQCFLDMEADSQHMKSSRRP